jgi:hypothetical protein
MAETDHPRGVVEVEFLGEPQKLRAALSVAAEVKRRLGKPFLAWVEELANVRSVHDIDLDETLVVFEELARAAGDPLPDDYRDQMILGDLQAVAQGIEQACIEGDVLEEESADEARGDLKKKGLSRPPRSRGESGRSSPSG